MSDDLIEIRIPLIVTSDGKWAANGSHELINDPDWAWMDEMCDHETPTVNPRRYWVTTYVKRPKVGEIPGAATPDSSVTDDLQKSGD